MSIWSPLTTNWAVNLVDSSSRLGVQIDTIQNHHTATNNKWVALGLFAPGGRTVTPNYFVAGNEIWGIVPEDRRAWTSGSAPDDRRAITIETLNLTNAPNWQFAADTIATLIRLNADLSRRYGIPLQHASPGVIEHRNLYEWFRRSYATACAGPSFDIWHVIEGAKRELAPTPPPPPPPPIRKEDKMLLINYKNAPAGKRGREERWAFVSSGFWLELTTKATVVKFKNQLDMKEDSFEVKDDAVWDRFKASAVAGMTPGGVALLNESIKALNER